MKTRKKFDMRRFGTAFVTLCLASMPLFAAAGTFRQVPTGPTDAYLGTPDYYTTANWANSPPLAKFVDTLPKLGQANNLGQYLSVAKPDTVSYPGSDYYEIDLVEYKEQMHSDMPNKTLLRGYVQVNRGTNTSVCGGAAQPDCSAIHNTLTPDPVHYLGPNIVAMKDRPVRIKFTNRLPSGLAGDLFIPVDETVMGAGSGPANTVSARGETGTPCNNTLTGNTCAKYPHNRADLHLHGGRTPWISDGTPHQWVTPADEVTPFTKGVSFQNVPDMPDPGDGSMTYYYSNQQSARLMFYHDHAFGITRLNVYAGEAAGYVLTDEWEQDLLTRNLLPPDQIPLIIQDKTFVDATPTTRYLYNPTTKLFDTPISVPQVRATDPLWNWGSSPLVGGVRAPVTGDLWLPHVYMPAQNSIAGSGGVNPFGRWMYGPWFFPATAVEIGPKANPYYDADCGSPIQAVYAQCTSPGQPVQIPGTPNVSMGMEAFQDSAMVNGTVFPSLTVDPRAYRFRILNAASDRFWNLSFYVADPAQVSPDTRPASRLTEVAMVPAAASTALANNWPADWPVDGRDGGVPDPGVCTGVEPNITCTNLGPSFLQIATEGGFLPKPVIRKPQPVTYITDPTAFWVGVVDKTGLALGPAERADVVVDFSAYAGKTLILYNDAPAAWPARVPGYDYFTGAPDLRDSGGYGTGGTFNPITGFWDNGTGPLVGYAPNTRTVMQVIVRATTGTDPAYTFNQAALEAEFGAPPAPVPTTALNPTGKTLFERAQDPIIVGQAAYADAYPGSYFPPNFPWEGINQINDHFLKFVTVAGGAVTAPTHPKGIHDEMGASFDPIYGRMSGNLAMQLPNPTTLNALLVLYGFSDLPTETISNSTQVDVQVLGTPIVDPYLGDLIDPLTGQPTTTNLGDGTQIWKISHNGVDTHPIHFHIFDVQLVNRVGWDGQIAMPEPNELGWKDTVKISPLMDTIVAVRPRAPLLPFGITNSLRPLNPAIPIDSNMGFNSVDWKTGQARVTPVTNILYDFKWEYVWHCHILSHEEMDMMRPIVLNVVNNIPSSPSNFNASYANNRNNLTWNDPTPAASALGNIANEVGFKIQRCAGSTCTNFTTIDTALANTTSYRDYAINPNTTYRYRMFAFNAAGNSANTAIDNVTTGATIAPTVSLTAPVNNAVYNVGDTITINATATVPNGVTLDSVDFYDGATLLGTDTTAPFSYAWTTATAGAHTITARVNHSAGAAVVSTAVAVTVNDLIASMITPTNASTLTGTSQTFSWTNVGATVYQIHVGTTGVGSDNLGGWPNPASNSTSTTVSGLPSDGSTVYVRLWSLINGVLQFRDYTYTAYSVSAATMISPANSSTLTGTSQTFSWGDTGATVYQIHVGTTGVGSDNLGGWPNPASNATSTTVSGLPSDGSTVYVRLWSLINGGLQSRDYTYTAYTAPPAATMISPANGSTLTGTSQAFSWTNVGATVYQLHVGTTGVGSDNLGGWPNPASNATSVTVGGLPSGGSTVYVRLWSLIGGVLHFRDYTYTAF